MSKKDLEITLGQIRKVIPQHLFKKNELRFLVSVGQAISCTTLLAYLAYNYIPLNWLSLPIWVIYAFITGTTATGIWVLGHECSHFAFSDTKWLNDALGFMLHQALLVHKFRKEPKFLQQEIVFFQFFNRCNSILKQIQKKNDQQIIPYFSLQHSHAIHHAKTNHLYEGETHTPVIIGSKVGKIYQKMKDILGEECFTCIQIFNIAVLGWPLYFLIGVSGGSARGFTSHLIVPNKLLPKKMLLKTTISNLGMCLVIYYLYKWYLATSFAEVMALYIGPYLVVNMWLTIITSMYNPNLQHNDLDIPHYDELAWTWLKGNLCTIDRNYPLWINAQHFDTGTTHVLHHLFSELPHYNAREANIYLKKVLGDLYHQDTNKLWISLYQTASLVGVQHQGNGVWKFVRT